MARAGRLGAVGGGQVLDVGDGSDGSAGRSRSAGAKRTGLEATLDGVSGSASSEVHTVGAAPGLESSVVSAVVALVARVAGAVSAASLLGLGVEAVSNTVGGSALGEVGTASLSAGVTSAADRGLGGVASRVAAHEAQTGHAGEHVGLGLSDSVGGESQDGGSGGSGEVHVDRFVVCFVFRRGKESAGFVNEKC